MRGNRPPPRAFVLTALKKNAYTIDNSSKMAYADKETNACGEQKKCENRKEAGEFIKQTKGDL